MKILFINISYLPTVGGVELIMANVAKGLLSKGHKVAVITPNTIQLKPAKLKRKENIDGVDVKRIKAYRLLPNTLPWFTPEIFSAISGIEADIIHVFSYHPTFITNAAYVTAKIKRIPLVVSPIYNPYLPTPYLNYWQRSWSNLYRKVIGPRMLKLANAVTAISESEAAFYRARKMKNVSMLPGAVWFEEKNVTTEDVQWFREKYGIDNAQVIISVGRMVKYKGFDLLVRAFAIAHKVLPESKLLIIGGDSGYRQELEEIINETGCQDHIILTGGISDEELNIAFETADIMVHPSLFETFGITIVEAWAHKKPVIAFDRIGKLISVETVVTVDYLDVEKMAQAIIRLLPDSEFCHKLGLQGYELVKKYYTWEKVVADIEEVYYSILKNHSTAKAQ